MNTYQHIPTGIAVEAETPHEACELIELEIGASDDSRSNGGAMVQLDDIEEIGTFTHFLCWGEWYGGLTLNE